jgi:hypothetical protein
MTKNQLTIMADIENALNDIPDLPIIELTEAEVEIVREIEAERDLEAKLSCPLDEWPEDEELAYDLTDVVE